MTKQEKEARRLVRERSGGICEACGSARATEWHHRKNRSQGGLWSASNGMDLCSTSHRYITEHPAESYERGWSVRSWDDPAEVPVQTAAGPVLLDDEGGRTPAGVPEGVS